MPRPGNRVEPRGHAGSAWLRTLGGDGRGERPRPGGAAGSPRWGGAAPARDRPSRSASGVSGFRMGVGPALPPGSRPPEAAQRRGGPTRTVCITVFEVAEGGARPWGAREARGRGGRYEVGRPRDREERRAGDREVVDDASREVRGGGLQRAGRQLRARPVVDGVLPFAKAQRRSRSTRARPVPDRRNARPAASAGAGQGRAGPGAASRSSCRA